MRQRYVVDWSDRAYPQIRLARGEDDAVTLTEAKRQIDDHFAYLIEHAQGQRAVLRELRAEDITD